MDVVQLKEEYVKALVEAGSLLVAMGDLVPETVATASQIQTSDINSSELNQGN